MPDRTSTAERLLQRYHTLSRRSSIQDPATRQVVFRAFDRALGDWLTVDPGSAILDIGCGEGALLAFLRDRGYPDLHGFDLSPENVDICHKAGFGFVNVFDALRLDLYEPGLSFDLILAFDILEHLPKQGASGFLSQVHARLRVGGRLILQTPNMGSVLGTFIRHNDLSHEFGVTEKTVVDLLGLAGFRASAIQVKPAWSATTALGRMRELWLRLLHLLVFAVEGSGRPRIPTKNLLVRAVRTESAD
jgi:2-polyprenyl-3-methyl-5-hydroxy-6-metoxy-1,4-benzoquinol methylase